MKLFSTALLALIVLLGLASPAQAALPAWPNVKIGANGPTVMSAQFLLRHRGYAIAADGDFGGGTESAVKQFQTSVGLTADGQIGPQTWPKLIVSVQRGNNSDAVRAAQIQLNRYGYGLVVDGDFGGGTHNAAVAFQTAQGLENNGIIGPITWQALVGGTPGGTPGAFSLPLARGDLPRSEYDDPHHDYPAIDLPVNNRPAYAMVSGTAYRINDGVSTGCGYGVKIFKDGVEYQYCHFSSWAVSNGQTVTAGQQVGTTGNTGNSTGPHLHIAIKINGAKYCPQNFLLAIYDGVTPPAPSSLPRTGCFY